MPTFNGKWEKIHLNKAKVGDILRPTTLQRKNLQKLKEFKSWFPKLYLPFTVKETEQNGDIFTVWLDIRDKSGNQMGFDFNVNLLKNKKLIHAYARRIK